MKKRAWEKALEMGGDQPPSCCIDEDGMLICQECGAPIRGQKEDKKWLCWRCIKLYRAGHL